MAIVGVGIDVVQVSRFAETVERTPSFVDRVFVTAEQLLPSGAGRAAESLAARFAAKEALAKALGGGGGMVWRDAVLTVDEVGRPSFELSGTVAARAQARGVRHVHVSLTHDGGVAMAVVIAED